MKNKTGKEKKFKFVFMKVRNYGEIDIFKNSQIDIFNDKIRRHFTTAVTAFALL